MRHTVIRQLPLTPALPAHAHLAELEEMSRVLDSNPEMAEAVHADLVRGVRPETGRKGLSGDQVLRAALLYQSKAWSFEELVFELAYHTAYRHFCRLSEDGSRIRTDCTVTEMNIHEPSDSALLWDCVRVLTDKLDRASELVNVSYSDHRKRAKRRAFAIRNAKRMKQRVRPYKDLLKVTRRTLGYAKRAAQALAQSRHRDASRHGEALQESIGLTPKVIEQTERRVLRGESVPAHEKVVSIFEPHTDVIRKDGRETLYGHKICLSVGASNLITDCVILDGNPADSTLTTKMMQRHVERFGHPPEQAAFDGAFGSKDNLRQLKDEVGIRDVAFSKAKWATVSDMVKDSWTYKRLRDFRAGVEAVISFLKRAFGLSRCRRRGRRAFDAHVRSSIVAANFLILARHALR